MLTWKPRVPDGVHAHFPLGGFVNLFPLLYGLLMEEKAGHGSHEVICQRVHILGNFPVGWKLGKEERGHKACMI
ncbi:hypothetical protein H671_5g14183 [Cricetulus griseus]|nr:hypothetical protein H671_5g14183 [Cricetulus griseus]